MVELLPVFIDNPGYVATWSGERSGWASTFLHEMWREPKPDRSGLPTPIRFRRVIHGAANKFIDNVQRVLRQPVCHGESMTRLRFSHDPRPFQDHGAMDRCCRRYRNCDRHDQPLRNQEG